MMALKGEKHLCVQLEKVFAEREALRRDRLGCASSGGLDGSREQLDRSASRESSIVLEEVSRERRRGASAASRSAYALDCSDIHPLMRKFYQSPYVATAEQYQEEEQANHARRAVVRDRAAERKQRRRRGQRVISSSEDKEALVGIPTPVRFKDRIKTFPKFNKPDGNMTWLDFVSQLVELLRTYQVPSNKYAAWLVDRLTGKGQAALQATLLNLTTEQRGKWAALMSALNAYFHRGFEMRTAEEELLVRKQGNKESVRDFIAPLMYLARKAYGQDIAKCEASVFKWLEFGLSLASLRRTFDDFMLEPGVNLSIMQAALVPRETRDDPGKYQTFITQECEEENAKKPKTPSATNIAKEVVKEVAGPRCGDWGERLGALHSSTRSRLQQQEGERTRKRPLPRQRIKLSLERLSRARKGSRLVVGGVLEV